MRKLNPKEKGIALAMANAVGSDIVRNQLLQDIQNCTVEDLVADGSMLRFHINGYARPPFQGQDTFRGADRFPVEGSIKDADGAEMDVLIFCDQNDRILEFEFVKHTGGTVMGPNWESFQLK